VTSFVVDPGTKSPSRFTEATVFLGTKVVELHSPERVRELRTRHHLTDTLVWRGLGVDGDADRGDRESEDSEMSQHGTGTFDVADGYSLTAQFD